MVMWDNDAPSVLWVTGFSWVLLNLYGCDYLVINMPHCCALIPLMHAHHLSAGEIDVFLLTCSPNPKSWFCNLVGSNLTEFESTRSYFSLDGSNWTCKYTSEVKLITSLFLKVKLPQKVSFREGKYIFHCGSFAAAHSANGKS